MRIVFPASLALSLALSLTGCSIDRDGMRSFVDPGIGDRERNDDVPFVPTPPGVVAAMLDLAEVGAGDSVIDLGSGDGRVAIAAGERGATALGVEIDPALVARANARARAAGVSERVRFRGEDLFQARLRDASVVTMYLLPDVNLRLRPRLLNELPAGARVVSHAFDMGDWSPDGYVRAEDKNVYLWIVPAVAGGRWRMTMADGGTATLALDQRYQKVTGTIDGAALSAVTLRGDRLRFTDRRTGRSYSGQVGLSAMTGEGWRATRLEAE